MKMFASIILGPMTSPCGMHHGVVYANVTSERKSDIEMLFMAHKHAKMDIGLETEVNIRTITLDLTDQMRA